MTTSEDIKAEQEMWEHLTAAEGYGQQMAEEMLEDIGYDISFFKITVKIEVLKP